MQYCVTIFVKPEFTGEHDKSRHYFTHNYLPAAQAQAREELLWESCQGVQIKDQYGKLLLNEWN